MTKAEKDEQLINARSCEACLTFLYRKAMDTQKRRSAGNRLYLIRRKLRALLELVPE